MRGAGLSVNSRHSRALDGLMSQAQVVRASVANNCVQSSNFEQCKSRLQQLYEITRQKAYSDIRPYSQDVQELGHALSSVPLEELGFDPAITQTGKVKGPTARTMVGGNMLQHNNWKREPVRYLHICDDPKFSIGIFCIPAGSRIPLHNHPGMTVFSRLLYGAMHVRAYDWLEEDDPIQFKQGEQIRRARLVTDRVLTVPSDTCVLYPNAGGNIHSFTAISNCAVLDVLVPPYATEDGRDCTYYREYFPAQYIDKGGRVNVPWAQGKPGTVVVGLQEYNCPGDFEIVSGTYKGLLVETS